MLFQTLDLYGISTLSEGGDLHISDDEEQAHTVGSETYNTDIAIIQYNGAYRVTSENFRPSGQFTIKTVDPRLIQRIVKERPGAKKFRLRLVERE